MLKNLITKLFSSEQNKNSQVNTPEIQVIKEKVLIYDTDPNRIMEVTKSPFPEGSCQGYVYFVQELLNGTFKIGKTATIDQEMNMFNENLPFKTQLIHLIKTGDQHQTETAFHKHLMEKHLESGWYTLNEDDVKWIKMENYTDNIIQTIGQVEDKSNKPLTPKQIELAKTLIKKLEKDYILKVEFSTLTNKDLNRLSVYFRYKNERALLNLVKKGVLAPRRKIHSK
ncbi:GIY-YIG nuclease family protein [Bacillus sp. SCS-153A]|uniref:GIY-YIG nuclease family protein n=1 Tax=Rossellomorea sedimentorum TaxID=3115294 RepID=UPI003905A247